jgi:hypothetical protein
VLGSAAPKAIGIGQASWNNARSLCGKALEWAGLASVPGHYLAPFAPAWAELWACLPPESALRHQLGRLFHFASAHIVPTEISDAVLATFHQALETESIVPDPYEIWRGAAKSWNNARSLCGKALEWAGLASVPGHYLARFAPAWSELWACLPSECALRHQLGRLFHYASAQRIAPNEINDAVLATFHQALETESIVPDPYEIWRGAAKSWNNAAERIPGWLQTRLTVPSRTRSFSMPWSAFPLTLQADVEAYLRRAAGLDLSDDHFTRAQRPATIEKRCK